MNTHFLILSLMLNCITFYPGQSAIAGDLLFLSKSTNTVTLFTTDKSTQSSNNISKPLADIHQRAKPLSIDIEGSKAITKFVTPNNDNKNDTFVFQAYNPMDLAVRGKIYSLKSRLVAKMHDAYIDDSDNYSNLEWNPNSGSERVKGGVYIYQIIIGIKVYKGTVVVIR